MKKIPVNLPLKTETRRCYGRWDTPLEVCEKRNECARHLTRKHPDEPWLEARDWLRLCTDRTYSLMIPIDGYEVEE